jgi:hypothetical protein
VNSTSFYTNKDILHFNSTALEPLLQNRGENPLPWMCPVSAAAAMKIMDCDHGTPDTKQELSASSPDHQRIMAIIYINHKWLHLTVFLKKKECGVVEGQGKNSYCCIESVKMIICIKQLLS